MDSVLHVKRFNPIPFLSWEREKKERSEPKINTRYTPPYLTSHILITFHLKPCGTVHIFYIFVNFKKKSAGLFLILGEHCVSAPSAFAPLRNVEVCKVPSAGQVEILQQTLHAKFGWNSWQQRAPYRLILQILDMKYMSYFWPNQKTFFLLQVSFRNFLKGLSLWNSENQLRAIFFKKKKKLDNIILSVIFQSFTSQINV